MCLKSYDKQVDFEPTFLGMRLQCLSKEPEMSKGTWDLRLWPDFRVSYIYSRPEPDNWVTKKRSGFWQEIYVYIHGCMHLYTHSTKNSVPQPTYVKSQRQTTE